LNSILLNCPDLEELDLNPSTSYKEPNSVKSLKLSKSTRVKKLAIECDALGEGVFDSLLLKCTHLNELNITLPSKWKEAIVSIYERCTNLQRLEIRSPRRIHEQERSIFLQEFYETEFFTSSPKCKSTLTHLTLKGFNAPNSKSEHFKYFERLKYIKYPFEFY
jgi:hypothetical protein